MSLRESLEMGMHGDLAFSLEHSASVCYLLGF